MIQENDVMTERSVSLDTLAGAVPGAQVVGANGADHLLSGLEYDSRRVAPGALCWCCLKIFTGPTTGLSTSCSIWCKRAPICRCF